MLSNVGKLKNESVTNREGVAWVFSPVLIYLFLPISLIMGGGGVVQNSHYALLSSLRQFYDLYPKCTIFSLEKLKWSINLFCSLTFPEVLYCFKQNFKRGAVYCRLKRLFIKSLLSSSLPLPLLFSLFFSFFSFSVFHKKHVIEQVNRIMLLRLFIPENSSNK